MQSQMQTSLIIWFASSNKYTINFYTAKDTIVLKNKLSAGPNQLFLQLPNNQWINKINV